MNELNSLENSEKHDGIEASKSHNNKKLFIKLEGISKTFGKVQANKNISLEINKGEILALLGENGSGKSTLVNMLAGIYTPDEGEIIIDGVPTVFSSPKDSIDAHIGMVHQHFKLVEVFSAQDNIIIGQKHGLFAKKSELTSKIMKIANDFGLEINPDKKVFDMSVSEKQTVEILKVLYRGADVLILDEPTAVLTPQEIRTLFTILRNMKNQGCAIIIITHKLNEVMDISDRVSILRAGECVGTVVTSETSAQKMTELMVGGAVSLDIKRSEPKISEKPLLQVKDIYVKNSENINVIDGMNFELYGGEILGVAGIAGSGQKELCELIAGLGNAESGSILFKESEILGLSPRSIIQKGISMSFVPEDRLGMGLVAGMDIVDNVLLKSYGKKSGFIIDRKSGKKLASDIVEKFNVSTPSVNHVVKKLSGGNIQKILLGREINLSPSLLITAYPVRGLDIGASYNIYEVLNQQKEKGVGVLFIGEDLDVLLELCDRLMVIHDGEIMDILDPKTTTKEEIGLLMLGHKPTKEDIENA